MAHAARVGVHVIRPPGYVHARAFDEVAIALVDAIGALGHDVCCTETFDASRRTIVLGANLLPQYPQEIPRNAVIFNLEQVQRGSVWMTDEALAPLRRHRVWDYSARNVAALRALGVDRVDHVPLGHAPALERIAHAKEKPIDVLFYGSLNERRIAVLDALEARGVRVVDLFGLYGEERDAAIAHARIVLNLHFYEAQILEEVRLTYLLANACFVVSETGDPDAEAPYRNGVAFAPYERVVDACLKYLADDVARARIAAEGQRLIRARPFAEFLRAPLQAWLAETG